MLDDIQSTEGLAGADNTWADVPKDELLRAIRSDCVTFFAFYMGSELTLGVPELHVEVWDELLRYLEEANKRQVNRILRKLFAIPRGFAKSTIAKLVVILFLKYSPFSFCLYVSKTNAHAKNAIRDIIMWLTSPNEKYLFGPSTVTKSSETESLWIMTISLRTAADRAPIAKRIILKALGADQQVRGLNVLNRRPQIIIIDDVEDNDNTTPELQPKTDVWIMGNLLKAFATEAFVLFIGNMIRETTLLARLSKDPMWNPTIFGSIVRHGAAVASLWEEKFPLENLLEEYRSYRKLGLGNVWEAEMMNLTQDQILAKDLRNVFRPSMPNPEDLTAGCIILDPAGDAGKPTKHLNRRNDEAAITVHARIRNIQVPVIIDSIHKKMDHEEMLDEMIRLSYYWGITTWFIEGDAAQSLYIPLFELLLQQRKIPHGIFLVQAIYTGGKTKPTRIMAFRTLVSSGSYGITDSQQEIVDKLASYNPLTAQHEDLEDSAAYGAVVWEQWNATIEAKGIQMVALAIMNAGGHRDTQDRTESDIATC